MSQRLRSLRLRRAERTANDVYERYALAWRRACEGEPPGKELLALEMALVAHEDAGEDYLADLVREALRTRRAADEAAAES
jgi:hypothetical protein